MAGISRKVCSQCLTSLSHQGKNRQEHSVSECGADCRAVEEQVGEREGEEQDAEKHSHLAGDRAQPLEERWGLHCLITAHNIIDCSRYIRLCECGSFMHAYPEECRKKRVFSHWKKSRHPDVHWLRFEMFEEKLNVIQPISEATG